MFPLGDDIPTQRAPIATYALLAMMGLVWVLVQGAGLHAGALAASVCNWGLVAGEITRQSPLGTAVPMGHGMMCLVDADAINYLTPLSSMFLHGSWAHIMGNGLFLWVFGKAVEDAIGRLRFVGFYLVCGLLAALAQVVTGPDSPVPMVGASGAISGVLGAYLVLYPRARIKMLFILFIFIRVILLPAWLVLLYWFGIQVLTALPQLAGLDREVPTGVAVMAHVGGFLAGLLLVRLFVNKRLLAAQRWRAPRFPVGDRWS